jgi:hypothetical protein
MKFRFYVDLPPLAFKGMDLLATTYAHGSPVYEGFRRVAFDVDLPIEMQDEVAAEPGKVVAEGQQV